MAPYRKDQFVNPFKWEKKIKRVKEDLGNEVKTKSIVEEDGKDFPVRSQVGRSNRSLLRIVTDGKMG